MEPLNIFSVAKNSIRILFSFYYQLYVCACVCMHMSVLFPGHFNNHLFEHYVVSAHL